MTIRSSIRLFVVAAGAALLLAVPNRVAAQAYVSAGPPNTVVLLDAYFDYPALLLTPPRSLDLLEVAAADPEGRDRMVAYQQFRRSLRERTASVVGTGSREERRRAQRKMLADIGDRLQSLPGGFLFRHGQTLWRQVQRATDFEVEGYRFRLQVDDAVEGKLALGVRKPLR